MMTASLSRTFDPGLLLLVVDGMAPPVASVAGFIVDLASDAIIARFENSPAAMPVR
jgi:hypothetical protein